MLQLPNPYFVEGYVSWLKVLFYGFDDIIIGNEAQTGELQLYIW